MHTDDKVMPAILDREISGAEQDAFGHRHFAQGLQSLIESEQLDPPFSIGLLGGWGTGKSSIKELYTNHLKNDASKQIGRLRKDRFHCITFNAWRFGGHDQDIKRALLRHVFLELGGKEDHLYDKLWRQVSETTQKSKSWMDITLETLRAWAMPIPALIAALSLLFGICYLTLFVFDVQSELLKSTIFLSVTAAYTYLLKHIKPAAVASSTPITRVELPSTTSEQYEDLLLEQIRKYKSGDAKSLEGRSGENCERLVVFVDDLDRLSAEEMVLGLDAVRTFMEIPANRLPNSIGLVFVISCDEAKVADALARGRRNSDLPGSVVTHNDARRYLDRIFQFRLEIPPPPRHDMREFARVHLAALTSVTEDIEARGFQLAPIIDRMIHVGVQDPRNALQIVNAFVQAWWIARKREAEGLGTNKPGGLHEGAVTSHPISLGALCAMKVSFPDFYRDLQEDHAFLQRFTDVVIRGLKLEDQPLQTQDRLKERYYRLSDGEFTLKAEHRPLRQFIASLVGLRWPPSLQSLLLLSEDHITRRLGPKIAPIYGDFVSGNTQGVLEGLARHNDNAPLHEDEARALYQMLEDLRHELPGLRARASRVVADLVERLPEPPAYQLISMLCREMADSLDLRSQLGLEKIGKILRSAVADDQRVIASRLVEDVLGGTEEVKLLRETMEPPSLDEATAMVHMAVPMVLTVRESFGLERRADEQILNWLLDRHISIGNKHTQLPFEELEQWLDDNSDGLVADLGLDYVNALVDELEINKKPEFDMDSCISRARAIFEKMMGQGGESRPQLWVPLSRYVSLYDANAVRMAWEVAFTNHKYADDEQFCHFVSDFVARQSKDLEDDGSTMEFEAAAETLIAFARERGQALDADTLEAASDLADRWAKLDVMPTQACALLSELRRNDETDFMRVLEGWVPQLFTNLPLDCVKLMAGQFEALTSSTQTAIATSLNAFLTSVAISDLPLKRYKAFILDTPPAVWKVGPLHGYLDSLIQNLVAQVSSDGYIRSILEPSVRLLKYASPSILGPYLQQLFVQGKGYPSHFSWMHHCLAAHWPSKSDNLPGYDPQVIFDEAATFALTNATQTKQGVLWSMRQMIQRGLVSSDGQAKLIAAACSVWSVSPNVALSIFEAGYCALTSDQAANLVSPIAWDERESLDTLQKAWMAIAVAKHAPAPYEVMVRILQKGPLSSTEQPDLAMRMWIQSQQDGGRELMVSLLTSEALEDGLRRRVWAFSIERVKELGAVFFLDVVPRISSIPHADETIKAVYDDFKIIVSVLDSKELQAEMATRLMNQFSAASTNSTKGRIAEVCNRLVSQAALKSFKPESLHKDEFEILVTHFGGRHMKKFERLLDAK